MTYLECGRCGGPHAVAGCTATPQEPALERAIRSLADNYRTRAQYQPEPRAQWADVEADLRRILAAEGSGS